MVRNRMRVSLEAVRQRFHHRREEVRLAVRFQETAGTVRTVASLHARMSCVGHVRHSARALAYPVFTPP